MFSKGSDMSSCIQVDGRWQLLFDDRFVVEAKGVEHVLEKPSVPAENLLPAEKPWELSRAGCYTSVAYWDGRFHMWYDALTPETRSLCYAESEDGIHFERPELDLVPAEDGAPTNVLVPFAAVGGFYTDPLDESSRRFKGLVRISPRSISETRSSRDTDCLHLMTSPDGIHWEVVRPPVFPMYTGSTSSTLWDDRIEKWVVYIRAHNQGRKYSRTEVEPNALDQPYPFTRRAGKDYEGPVEEGRRDLVDELPIVLAADADDPPGAQIYNMNALKYAPAEDAYLAFPAVWYSQGSDRLEAQLAVSRDGISWQRPWREPVIPCGLADTQSAGQIYPARELIARSDELWLYYSALPSRHLTGRSPAPYAGLTGRAIWQRDRFAAVRAGTGGGSFATPPLVFEGKRLRLNANASASGEVRVGVRRASGNWAPGFGLEECDSVYGNGLEHEVSWKGGADIGGLAGQPVRFHLALRNASVYAFSVT